jgi:hypothetical protein
LYLCTTAIAQSSAKRIGSGGERWIFLPQLLSGPLCKAHLSSCRLLYTQKLETTYEYHSRKGQTQM